MFGLNLKNMIQSYNKQFTADLDDAIKQEMTSSLANNNVMVDNIRKLNNGSGSFIHIGCGLGTLCFELSSEFDFVLGMDYSGRLIDFYMNVKNGKVH